jgi:glycosyltransferase involved in cell wall biosynthesis
MKKIILNIGSTSWETRKGGGAAVVREQVKYFRTTNFETYNFEVCNNKSESKNIHYAKPSDNLFIKNYNLLKSLLLILNKNKNSNIFIITHNIPVFILSLFFLKLSNYKYKHIHYFHGPAFLESEAEGANKFRVKLIWLFEMIFFSLCNNYVFLSIYFKNLFLEKYYKNINFKIVPYSVVELPKKEIRNENRDEFKMLCVRRLQKRMGIDTLIKSCALITSSKFSLKIVGTGPESIDLKKLITELKLNDKIQLVGRLEDHELKQELLDSNISIMPTRSLEGFGISIIDSLILGTPVVAFPVGGIPEILTNLSNDLIVNDQTVEGLARKISNIIELKDKPPSSDECYEYVLANYTKTFNKLREWLYTL